MDQFDLTAIVTAHSESVVAGPAMRAAEIAIASAESDGYKIERLIGMDSATKDCRTFFHQEAFARWTIRESKFSNPSLHRNALAEIASGSWIAFLDADDLVSANWLTAGLARLRERDAKDGKLIVHPEINWVFDGASFVFTKPAQDDEIFNPFYFYMTNYYDTMSISPRAAHLECPYVAVDIPGGFGHEDWQWNIETIARGWRHVVAKDTIIFKRRRDMSVSVENVLRGTVLKNPLPLAIDRMREFGRTEIF